MGIRYSLYLNIFIDWRALDGEECICILRKDNILSWQMYKQSKQGGQASSKALETLEGCKCRWTWSMQEVFKYWARCKNYLQGTG